MRYLFAAAVGFGTCGMAPAPRSLDNIVNQVNLEIEKEHLNLKKLTKDELLIWFADYLPLQMVKESRAPLEKSLAAGSLPQEYSIEIDTRKHIPIPDLKPLIILKSDGLTMPIIEGHEMRKYTDFARMACKDESTCTESFQGEIPSKGLAFPSNIYIKIQESKAPGVCLTPSSCLPDVLDITILVTSENLSSLVEYFGQGFDKQKISQHLSDLLGNKGEKLVALQDFMMGWVKVKANTFPVNDDNEVCHGPARQFFSPELQNGSYDRSTEATAVLLKKFYCQITDQQEPTFGDYLYVPSRHSGRFILKDPASQRWVAFSVQSGGASAFRFWWADEDFSGKPFDKVALPQFRERFVDVWRRCRI